MNRTQAKTSAKELATIITASSVGTIIEWYDFYIFASLATIISTRFFPKENPVAAFLATLATFSAGLVVRPFGALFFGRLGDLVGRKYTFMITLLLMGGSTFAIGLVPEYKTIGFLAPVIVLILRLLQGLAIGGEYGGAATFVAEHSPAGARGFWTSWIQTTTTLGFVISMGVILISKNSMSTNAWESWGWRIPFLASAFMVVISVWIRKNMKESPLFTQAKAEGKTSANPLKESFGNKANFKLVLLALFGLIMGLGVVGYSASFYSQSFLLKVMFVDYDQANKIVMTAILSGVPFYIFFGWLSDRIGRKYILMCSLLMAILFFRPIFENMYQTTNLQHKVEDRSAMQINTKRAPVSASDTDPLITTTTLHSYTDGTTCTEIKTQTISAGITGRPEFIKSIKLNNTDEWKLIFLIFLLMIIFTMSYGPLAAFVVEMFPLKIRYTSMSLPYHIGYGIFGGMSLVIATYLIEKAKVTGVSDYYLAGLNYPIVLMSVSLVIGLLYLKENKEGKTVLQTHSKRLNKAKRFMGWVWILLGLAAAYFGVFKLGIPKLTSGNRDDLIFAIIVMFFITPVASLGLILFGKYAIDGEYDAPVP
jgi:MFS family permease